MPIYEYQCSDCKHSFDLIQKINDEPAKVCPACNKNTAVRLISAAGFQLKGSGWYVTDFKNKGSAPQTTTNTESKDKQAVDTAPAKEKTVAKEAVSSSAKGEST